MPNLLPRRERVRGQVLVIFVIGFFALIAGTAFVVDGANVMGQQRGTQNGADAASEAGTVVIAQYLMGGTSATGATGTCPTTPADPWDLEVCKAVYGSAAQNNVAIAGAQYTDFKGAPIGAVGAGTMPAGSQGVQAFAKRQFDTYFARAIGMPTFTATTQATAVTGTVTTLCAAGSTCGLFPITVPFEVSNCDNTGKVVPGTGPWPFLGNNQTTTANEAIVPLCKDKNNDIGGGSAGSVGWLDLSTALGATTTGSCPNQFKNAITNPCIVSLPFPTWIQTFPGGVGKGGGGIQDYLNAFHDDVVQVPLFDGTCKQQPPGPALGDCDPGDIGVGNNTWYHVPSFASFKLDYFYIDGNDRKQCDQLPGQPFVSGNGANGCFKGWWVIALPGPGAVGLGTITPSTTNQLGVQLIK
jgi:Putative Flp pilus-assembly TadE/G-like